MTAPDAKILDLEHAANLLRAGEICAIPTETVYGLAADATNSDAVLKIYQAKSRPRFNPLIVHCADLAMANELVEMPEAAQKLSQFWPGSLSIVSPIKSDAAISNIVTAGLDTLAVRIPAHPMARELIRLVGKPLAAPSANPSGKLSATTADQVVAGFDGRIPVLDGGPCANGLESTIVAIDGNKLVQLRAGAVPRAAIETAWGSKVSIAKADDAITAPGMLKSHYAPNAALRLNATIPKSGEAYLAFGMAPVHDGQLENLSPSADLAEAAQNLFSMLHKLDAGNADTIAVAPIPQTGLGEAINDRLQRAAAPRG